MCQRHYSQFIASSHFSTCFKTSCQNVDVPTIELKSNEEKNGTKVKLCEDCKL